MASQPRDGRYFRGVAPVPHRRRRRPTFGDTDDVSVAEPLSPTLTDASLPERDPGAARLVPAGRGLVVRRRWPRLRAGAGWSWTGLSIVLVCWGIWAVSLRGNDLLVPVIGLGLVLGVAALLFVVARLLGRAVLEQLLNRERTSAWPSHLTVCGFLTLAGIAFLQQIQWIQDSWRWFGDSWQWLVDSWNWLINLWPW